MNLNLTKTFQSRLTQAIFESGLSLRGVAYRSGFSDSYLGRLLNGVQSNPSLHFVEVMAETLGVSVAWLLGLEGITDEVSERNVLAS